MKVRDLKALLEDVDDDADVFGDLYKVNRFRSYSRVVKLVSSSEFVFDDEGRLWKWDDEKGDYV